MPRSGSTLLQNILAQNPRFYCTPTSGLFNLLYAARAESTRAAQFKAQDGLLMRRAFLGFCKGAVEGFVAGLTDKPVAIDKSRDWFHHYPWVSSFLPEVKILVCVRDLRAVVSSMEKLFRKNAHLHDPLDAIGKLDMITTRNRVAIWLNTLPLGTTLMRLIEAIETGRISHFHIVRFEDLTTRPRETIDKIYAYIGEERFGHDFDSVEQKTVENDAEYPIYGDHRIRAKVEPMKPDYNDVLGKDVADQIKSTYPKYYQAFYPELR
jgi:sulfotransferase